MDVNEELKYLGKLKKKMFFFCFFFWWGGRVGGSGWM